MGSGNHISIYLDGIRVADNDWVGTNIEVNQTFDNKSDYTTDVEFYGAAYQLIKKKLIDNRVTFVNMDEPTPDGVKNIPVQTITIMNVKIFDNCCGSNVLIFDGRLDNLSFSPKFCKVKATLIQNTIYTEISKYYLNKSGAFNSKKLNYVGYCAEPTPNFIHDFIVVIGFFAKWVMILAIGALFPTFLILEIILKALKFFLGVIGIHLNFDLNLFDVVKNLFRAVNEFVFDCLKMHPSAYVRDFVQDIVDNCGVTGGWVSPIFNDAGSPYYNTVWFQAEVSEGIIKDDNSNFLGFISANSPVYAANDFLDMICKAFDAEWRVIGDTLIIKHKTQWLNSEILPIFPSTKTEDYNTNDNENPAYGDIQFTIDGMDQKGNTARNVWYRKILEWNSPPAFFKKGNKTFSIPFAPHRQVNDGVDRSVTWYWINDSILSPVIDLIFARDPSEVDKLLSLSNGIALTPKLLIWDENTERISELNKYYHVKDIDSDGNEIEGELARYFDFENPRANGFKFFQFTIQSDPLTCKDFTYYSKGLGKRIRTAQGLAVINNVKINYSTREITYSGVV
jgi:hypothetical protein